MTPVITGQTPVGPRAGRGRQDARPQIPPRSTTEGRERPQPNGARGPHARPAFPRPTGRPPFRRAPGATGRPASPIRRPRAPALTRALTTPRREREAHPGARPRPRRRPARRCPTEFHFGPARKGGPPTRSRQAERRPAPKNPESAGNIPAKKVPGPPTLRRPSDPKPPNPRPRCLHSRVFQEVAPFSKSVKGNALPRQILITERDDWWAIELSKFDGL